MPPTRRSRGLGYPGSLICRAALGRASDSCQVRLELPIAALPGPHVERQRGELVCLGDGPGLLSEVDDVNVDLATVTHLHLQMLEVRRRVVPEIIARVLPTAGAPLLLEVPDTRTKRADKAKGDTVVLWSENADLGPVSTRRAAIRLRAGGPHHWTTRRRGSRVRLKQNTRKEARQGLRIPSIAVFRECFSKLLLAKAPGSLPKALWTTLLHKVDQSATQVRQILPFLSLEEDRALKRHQISVEREGFARSRKPLTQLVSSSLTPIAQFLETRRYHFG